MVHPPGWCPPVHNLAAVVPYQHVTLDCVQMHECQYLALYFESGYPMP